MITIEIQFAPEHHNAVCGCTIPEGWEGIVRVNNEVQPKLMGDSEQEVLMFAKEHYPGFRRI